MHQEIEKRFGNSMHEMKKNLRKKQEARRNASKYAPPGTKYYTGEYYTTEDLRKALKRWKVNLGEDSK